MGHRMSPDVGAAPGPAVLDPMTLRALHDAHVKALSCFVLRLTGGDHASTEDVVQEAMLRAWRHPEAVCGPSSSPRGWLFTVARRIVIDEWRSKRRRREVLTDRPPDVVEPDTTQSTVDRDAITQALRQLTKDQREIVVERYVRGSSVMETAAVLQVPLGTVKSRSHYALNEMSRLLATSSPRRPTTADIAADGRTDRDVSARSSHATATTLRQ